MIGRPNEIEVIEEQPAFCKLNPKGYRSPAIFSLNFRGETAKRQLHDLKIFASSIHREPSELHNEKFFSNVIVSLT